MDKFYPIPVSVAARTDLTATAKLTYAAIVFRIGKNESAWPGIRGLASMIGVRVQTVFEAIHMLENKGILEVERGGIGKNNRYRLPMGVTETVTPTVTETVTLFDDGCYGNRNGGVTETVTQVLRKPLHKRTSKRFIEKNKVRARSETPVNGADFHDLIRHFTDAWASRFNAKYPFNKARDPGAAKAILLAVEGDLSRAKSIVSAYVATTDRWLVERGCGLTLLAGATQLPRFIASESVIDTGPPFIPCGRPIVYEDAEARGWGDDIAAHPAEWRLIRGIVDECRVRDRIARDSKCATPEEFRNSLKEITDAYAARQDAE